MALTQTTVETTIETIQSGGQSVAGDGLSVSRAPAPSMIELRERLQNETLRSGGTRPLFRACNLTAMGY